MTFQSIAKFSNRAALTIAMLASSLAMSGGTSTAFAETSFKDDVLPILELRCMSCHKPGGQGYERSGLDMRTYDSLMKGTKHGSVVTPRNALESNLMAVIEHRTDKAIWMPHNKKQLSNCEIKAVRHWISQGAQNN